MTIGEFSRVKLSLRRWLRENFSLTLNDVELYRLAITIEKILDGKGRPTCQK